MLCLPHSGGSKETFRPWTRHLAEVAICAAGLPGRDRRIAEAPLTSAGTIVRHLADSLSHGGDAPWTIFGHSTGAIVAFELARELRRRGMQKLVRALILSACGAPHLDAKQKLHRLGDEALVEALVRVGGTSAEVLSDPTMRALFLPIIRADAQVGETYVPAAEPPLELPVFAYAGVLDKYVPLAAVEAWRTWAPNLTSRRFPGGHFYFADDPTTFFQTLRGDL